MKSHQTKPLILFTRHKISQVESKLKQNTKNATIRRGDVIWVIWQFSLLIYIFRSFTHYLIIIKYFHSRCSCLMEGIFLASGPGLFLLCKILGLKSGVLFCSFFGWGMQLLFNSQLHPPSHTFRPNCHPPVPTSAGPSSVSTGNAQRSSLGFHRKDRTKLNWSKVKIPF